VTESADTVIARTSSRRPLWQRLIRYVLLVAIFAIPAAVLLSYEGFCFDRARFVGENEMIEAAVRGIAGSNRMAIDASDAAIKDFLRGNPNCCAVDRHPRGRSLLDVVTGWNVAEVEVNYERSSARASRAEPYYKQFVSVSSCGQFLKSRYGTGTSTLETVSRLEVQS
jgi:hypothetical protein